MYECFFASTIHNVTSQPVSSTSNDVTAALRQQIHNIDLRLNDLIKHDTLSHSRLRQHSPLIGKNATVWYDHRYFEEKVRKCSHPCSFQAKVSSQGNKLMMATAPGHTTFRIFYLYDNRTSHCVLIDTGTEVSVLPLGTCKRNLQTISYTLQTTNSTITKTYSRKLMALELG